MSIWSKSHVLLGAMQLNFSMFTIEVVVLEPVLQLQQSVRPQRGPHPSVMIIYY